MKMIAVIGHFGFGHTCLNGQTVKTKILTQTLEECFGEAEVLKIDTHGGVKTLFKAPFQILSGLKNCKNVVILPAHNGLRVNAPLLAAFRKLFPDRKIHYAVIGGWLPKFLEGRKGLTRALKGFDGIYVETNTMRIALEQRGFANVQLMLNCKNFTPLEPEELVLTAHEPYKLCTFSRVMAQKGIAEAAAAVKAVNEKLGRTVYTLDIYGPVDPAETGWFDALQKDFPPYVQYKGSVPFDRSVEVLKDYFALLFPTLFFTEGVPGTIIDGYAAGIPVISARWESFSDVVDDESTGLGYTFGDTAALEELLLSISKTPERVLSLKKNCLRKSLEFTPKVATGALLDKMK